MALFDLITKTIQADDWSFQVIETESVIALDITLESGQFRCYFLVDEETECVQFHTVLPVNVPLKKRNVACEFICRVNYVLLIGHLDIDLDDGEVRYKTSGIFQEAPVTLNSIRNLIYPNLMMADHYFPAFLKVIYGDADPAEILEALDDDLNDEFDEFDEFDATEQDDDDHLHFDPRDLN
jgi:hypothetical protein